MRALRWRELKQKVGLSRTTIWRLEQSGDFPRRRRLSPGIVAWLSDEVDAWLKSGGAETRTPPDRVAAPKRARQ